MGISELEFKIILLYMNLLLINYEYPPIGAGAANATYHIAKECTAAGHDVTVLTSSFKTLRGMTKEEGVNVYRCSAIRRKQERSNIVEMISFIVSAIFVLPKVVSLKKYDGAIVFFSFPGGPVGLMLKSLYKVPYIVSLRGGDVPGSEPSLRMHYALLKPLRRLILKQSIAITANSAGLKEMSEKADPYPVKYIPNGVDADYYCPSNKEKGAGDFQFLFVGRFREQKNIVFMFDRLKELRESVKEHFILNMVGDGPLNLEIRRKAITCGLNDIIRWYGWLDKASLRDIYRQTDCLLNISLYEGMPNVIMEAMACKLTVIAVKVQGNNELVRDKQTGYLVDVGDVDGFVSAMKDLLQNSYKLIPFGEQGRDYIMRNYSWRETARTYVNILIGAVNNVRGKSC